MTVKAMTPCRKIIEVELALLQAIAPYYVQAADGVYVPSCDIAQYERGCRPVVAEEQN